MKGSNPVVAGAIPSDAAFVAELRWNTLFVFKARGGGGGGFEG